MLGGGPLECVRRGKRLQPDDPRLVAQACNDLDEAVVAGEREQSQMELPVGHQKGGHVVLPGRNLEGVQRPLEHVECLSGGVLTHQLE